MLVKSSYKYCAMKQYICIHAHRKISVIIGHESGFKKDFNTFS